MIRRSIQISGISLLGLILSLGLVSAQPAPAANSEGSDTSTEVSPSEAEQNQGASAPLKSLAQLVEEARTARDRMAASADNIARMLRKAREEKDVVKVLCLDDKLSQMNVASRSAADRFAGLEDAVKLGNSERARHEEAVLSALVSRTNELSTEANQCIGEEKGVVGGSTLNVTIDPAIPATDTATPVTPTSISSPPVAASPTI